MTKPTLVAITAFQPERAQYFPALVESLKQCFEYFELIWMPVIGPDKVEKPSLGDKWNYAIQHMPDNSWGILLDSDNILHPGFAEPAREYIDHADGIRLFLGRQYDKHDHWRIEHPKPIFCHVDNGQVLFHKSLGIEIPYRDMNTNLDGYWVEDVHKAGHAHCVADIPFYYNFQR